MECPLLKLLLLVLVVLVLTPLLQISECSVEEDQRDEVVCTVWARTT